MTDSIISIGYEAFSGCSALESITLPWVNEDTHGTFQSSHGLFGFIFGINAYDGGTKVTQFYRTHTNQAVTQYTVDFYIPSNLKTVTVIADKVWNKGVGEAAFSGCTMIETVKLPDDGSVSSYMFYGCTSLKSVNIPSDQSSKIIWDCAFYGCSSLQSISIPSHIEEIGYGAFDGCSSLANVTLPSSLKEIGDSAFSGCASLTSISIPSRVTEMGSSVFYGCTNLASIYVNTTRSATEDWGSRWSGDAQVHYN